jgi:hypothetical protein
MEDEEHEEQKREHERDERDDDDDMEDEEHEARKREHEHQPDNQQELRLWPESQYKQNSEENGMGVNVLLSNTATRQEKEEEIIGWAGACAQSVEQHEQPQSLKQAFARPDAQAYVQAAVQEIKQLQKYNSFKRMKRTAMHAARNHYPHDMYSLTRMT